MKQTNNDAIKRALSAQRKQFETAIDELKKEAVPSTSYAMKARRSTWHVPYGHPLVKASWDKYKVYCGALDDLKKRLKEARE